MAIQAFRSNLGLWKSDLFPGCYSESPEAILVTYYPLDLGGLWQVSLCWHLASEKISANSDSIFRDSSRCIVDLTRLNKQKEEISLCWWSRRAGCCPGSPLHRVPLWPLPPVPEIQIRVSASELSVRLSVKRKVRKAVCGTQEGGFAKCELKCIIILFLLH